MPTDVTSPRDICVPASRMHPIFTSTTVWQLGAPNNLKSVITGCQASQDPNDFSMTSWKVLIKKTSRLNHHLYYGMLTIGMYVWYAMITLKCSQGERDTLHALKMLSFDFSKTVKLSDLALSNRSISSVAQLKRVFVFFSYHPIIENHSNDTALKLFSHTRTGMRI